MADIAAPNRSAANSALIAGAARSRAAASARSSVRDQQGGIGRAVVRPVLALLDSQDIGGATVRNQEIGAVFGSEQRRDGIGAGEQPHQIIIGASGENGSSTSCRAPSDRSCVCTVAKRANPRISVSRGPIRNSTRVCAAL